MQLLPIQKDSQKKIKKLQIEKIDFFSMLKEKQAQLSSSAKTNKYKTSFRFFKNQNKVEFNKQNYDSNRQMYAYNVSGVKNQIFKQFGSKQKISRQQEFRIGKEITRNSYRMSQIDGQKVCRKGWMNCDDQNVNENINVNRNMKNIAKIQLKKQSLPKPTNYGHRTYRSTQRLSCVQFNTKYHAPAHQQSFGLFNPKNKQQITRRHNQYRMTHNTNQLNIDTQLNNVFYQDKINLQKLLVKNKLYAKRCLIGQNIPKIQQKYQFSRFQLFNLYTYYKTLLKYSNKSIQQFKKGFQSILFLNKIQLNSQMIQSYFTDFFNNISFDNFIKIYGSIQNLLFTQTIIDFIMYLFSEYYREEWFTWEKMLEVLKEKIEENQSLEIRKILFEHFVRKENEMVQMKEIIKACENDITICRKIFNTMSKLGIVVNNKKK